LGRSYQFANGDRRGNFAVNSEKSTYLTEVRQPLNRESIGLALMRFMGNGDWWSFADLWTKLKKERNPLDTEAELSVALDVLALRGCVEERAIEGACVIAYRLVRFVD
jgi:hypothetical protein